MELALASTVGATSKNEKLDVSEVVFGKEEFNEPLVHQVVTAYRNAGRAGTKSQKTRSQVSGGGAKPWRQKGTGRARAGTSRSPIWVGGGATFAAVPRDYSQKVNKKMYRGAMCNILSELVRQERLLIVKDLNVENPKTKELIAKLGEFGLKEALIVTNDFSKNLYLASRNIPKVDVRDVKGIDPVSLIKFDKVIMTEGAVRKLEEVLG